jgi:hypothetical protein
MLGINQATDSAIMLCLRPKICDSSHRSTTIYPASRAVAARRRPAATLQDPLGTPGIGGGSDLPEPYYGQQEGKPPIGAAGL